MNGRICLLVEDVAIQAVHMMYSMRTANNFSQLYVHVAIYVYFANRIIY